MRRSGRSWPGWLLCVVVAAGCAAAPASALGATLANGVYTAAPGERNLVQVVYLPESDSYRFMHGVTPTDADGPGGCSVVDFVASCPASAISKIVIHAGDVEDLISIGPGGFIPNPGPPFGPSFSDVNQVRIPAEVYGGEASDIISGGWGADRIDGGPGTDLVDGYETSFFAARPDSEVQARDLLTCGTGGDQDGGNGFAPEDTALMGQGDQVGIDCEAIQQLFTCPPKGPTCTGVAPVEATVTESGKSAAASGRRSGGKRTVLLGTGKFNVRPGQLGQVITRLNGKRVRKVVSGDKSVPARSTLLAKQQKKKKKKLLGRTRFRLIKKG